MKTSRILLPTLGLCVVAAMAGCATHEKFAALKEANSDTARLYVFRSCNPPLAYPTRIVVNGVRAASLPVLSYLDLELPPGDYTVTADWPWLSGVPDSEFTLQAEKGKRFCISIDTSMYLARVTTMGNTAVPRFALDGCIRLVDDETAFLMMSECREVKTLPGVDAQIHPE